ncbi:MAG: alpha/beta hydrolase [Planctomycetota bacterium]
MSIHASRRDMGRLRCRIVDALSADVMPKRLVVLCHGYGAGGDDLVDFAPMLMENSELIAQSCRFIFPAAPHDLADLGMPGGRAWWPINMARLAEMQQTRNFDDLTLLEPPGMAEASSMLRQTIDLALADHQLSESKLILGGFSQGAMVSTNVTLQGLRPALLAIFSGTLLNRTVWQRLAEQHPGCDVVQSHGHQDPLLPMSAARDLKQVLETSAFRVQFTEFYGGHTIPMPALAAFQSAIEASLRSDS